MILSKTKYINLLLNPDKLRTEQSGKRQQKEILIARKAFLNQGYYTDVF